MEKLKKPMLIACGGFIILFIFMFIMSSCNKKTYTTEEFVEHLVDKAKNYYEYNKTALPQTSGSNSSISIFSLVEKQEDYIKDVTCNGSIDVINNNNYYMYIPNISCTDGYASSKLSEYLTSNEKIVSTGNGLYQMYDYYIFRGDNVNNYLIFNDQLWRILRINNDGSVKIIETDYIVKEKKGKQEYKKNKRLSETWDDRYNSEKAFTSGFNDFIHEGHNSRIKDKLDDIYKNDFKDDTKGYIVAQNLCIGKRAVTDIVNDGSIECSNIIGEQYVGLLALYEYINASLDKDCVGAESRTCANYNYLATMNTTFWSITAVSENSYDVYKIGYNITDATANSNSTPKIVLNLSSEVRFTDGDGSYEKPFVIN